MSLVKWDPYREFDNFFAPSSRFFNPPDLRPLESSWKPLVDVTEDDKEYLIKAELPEVKKEDINISTSNGYLTLKGERKFEKEDKKLHTMERFYGSFERRFILPDDTNEKNIDAEFKDGLLIVHMKKSEMPRPEEKNIKIK